MGVIKYDTGQGARATDDPDIPNIGDFDGAVLKNPRYQIDSQGTSGGRLPGGDLGGFTPQGYGSPMPTGLANVYGAWASGNDGMTDIMKGMMGMTPISDGDYTQAMTNASVFGMPTIDLNIGGVQNDLMTYAANNPSSQIAQNLAAAGIDPNSDPMDAMNQAVQNVANTQYFPQRRDDNSAYTQDEIDQLVGLLNDGVTTVDDVGTFYGIPPALIQAQLDYINSQAEKEPEDTDTNQQPGAGNQGNQGTADQGVNFPGVVFPTGGYGDDASVMGPFPPGDQTPNNQPDVDDADPNDPDVLFPQTPGTDPTNTPDVDDQNTDDPDVILDPPLDPTLDPDKKDTPLDPDKDPPADEVDLDEDNEDTGSGLSIPDIIEGGGAIAGTARALGGDMSTFFGDRMKEITRQDPEYRSRGLGLFGELPINQTLTDRLNAGYTNFAGNRFAPAGTDMLNYEQRTRDNLDAIPGQALFDRSVAATEGRAPIRDIVAGSFAGSDLSPYMNPYTESVIDTTLADIEKERQQQILRNNAIATQAGAYGGDRAALVNAQTNRAAADRKAEVAAMLRARGFDQAADLYAADADRAMVGDRSNQLADVYEQRNQLSEGQDLLRAFGYGSDAYRDYLGDFGLTAGRVDDRAQRELDFLFDEHLASQGYDQDMIDNLIRLFSASPQEQEKTTETEMSTVTRIGDVLGLANQLPGAAQSAKDALEKIGIL